MPTTRQLRVNELLREAVSRIIQKEVSDPRVGFATVTDVSVTPDLREAHVFVSVLGGEAERLQSVAALQRAARFIRGQLGKAVELRAVPELTFEIDRTAEHADRVEKLFHQLDEEKKQRQEEE